MRYSKSRDTIYEIECQRSNVTPKQFFNYCRKLFESKGLDVESWTSFEDWVKPIQEEPYHSCYHADWEIPCAEACKYMPYNIQMYLQHSYNFIMEFEFYDGKRGYGYLYAVEFKR